MTFLAHKKIFRLSKGFFTKGKNCLRIANTRVEKALQHTYVERKLKKRDKRKEWIQTINAGVREHGIKYSRFIYALNHSNIVLDRKILAELAINEPFSFKAVIDEVKLQTGLVAETKPFNLESVKKAVMEGTVILPGATLPPLEEVKEKAKGKPYVISELIKFKTKKLPKPTEEQFQKVRVMESWDSDWEDDRHYDTSKK